RRGATGFLEPQPAGFPGEPRPGGIHQPESGLMVAGQRPAGVPWPAVRRAHDSVRCPSRRCRLARAANRSAGPRAWDRTSRRRRCPRDGGVAEQAAARERLARTIPVIVSVDFAKQEDVGERIWQQDWDLVIMDEAHECSTRTGSAGVGREPKVIATVTALC